MSKVPSLNYTEIVRAFQRDGWTVVRQKGSHIRLEKDVKRSTLSHILKQARLSVDEFKELL